MISQKVRWGIFERDDYRCRCCGSRVDLAVDHIQPRRWGGTDDLDNLQTLCRRCNVSKRDLIECRCTTEPRLRGHNKPRSAPRAPDLRPLVPDPEREWVWEFQKNTHAGFWRERVPAGEWEEIVIDA